jgi:hypothetical protein
VGNESAGPNGDPYHVDSANNGPYGDAFTQELVPWIRPLQKINQ